MGIYLLLLFCWGFLSIFLFYQNNQSSKEVKGYEQQTVCYGVTMRNNEHVQ